MCMSIEQLASFLCLKYECKFIQYIVSDIIHHLINFKAFAWPALLRNDHSYTLKNWYYIVLRSHWTYLK